jgi:ribosomal protein S18 acetylase RimI-like enzyme
MVHGASGSDKAPSRIEPQERPVSEEAVPDYNLFMVCERPNPAAFSEMPAGFTIRFCRPDKLETWKRMHFDTPAMADEYSSYMDDYFAKWYAPKGDLFYRSCLFVCTPEDDPVATCFSWKQYDLYTTIHWFKVVAEYEGLGIGRALLSHVMRPLVPDDYPVYLHTQPSSTRAIKLYTDFGFAFIDLPVIDHRENGLAASLPILQRIMTPEAFARIRIVTWDPATETFRPVSGPNAHDGGAGEFIAPRASKNDCT